MQTASSGQGSIKIITTALRQPMHEQLCFNLHLHRTLWGDLYNRALHRTLWDCTILKSTMHEELCSITCTYTGHYGLHCSKKHYRERYGMHCAKEIHQNYLLHCWTKAPLPILFFCYNFRNRMMRSQQRRNCWNECQCSVRKQLAFSWISSFISGLV